MRLTDQLLASKIKQQLLEFNYHRPMPGISIQAHLDCLVEQIIDSTRRIQYITKIKDKAYSANVANPASPIFDPLKAAVFHKNQGNTDEAFWLIFLFVHFGKHQKNQWKLIQNIYGALSADYLWNWENTSANPNAFEHWLVENQTYLKETGRFGNHRKYETLDTNSKVGTSAVIKSYIDWVGGSHVQMIEKAKSRVENDPKKLFAHLYKSMKEVIRFGRTAKFDYLTMIGKIGLVDLVPDSTYLNDNATGPLRGAHLLFGGQIKSNHSTKELHNWIGELEEYLGLSYGMQVLEDSLCNWQKSPDKYDRFIG
ncbi:hypothetical protein QNI19_32120 [Cytophagaceae bacterium DM2B3-1]|uniref:Alpha-glutamyl/putrescinyl thymine pyrophosphorylase clade 3 domain-containing protein n=1 Tax=Xanthocytophaga flava TaxID=3048013 RepID=A0ABT7CXD6_9BACT|nr:hypothetical protein [Xanthocytophaga flavus]MDJ1497630.1 hypothetical protein [Xanthocytophaga flavus]